MESKISVVAVLTVIGVFSAMATEEAKYEVVRTDGDVEIRDYASHIVAETVVDTNMEEAGNQAFNKLFNYISGNNSSQKKIEMTAPVSQEAQGEEIAMTAPVAQETRDSKYAVSFMMPASFTMETIPAPKDETVKIREIPARRVASIRYSGRWTEENYLNYKKELEEWMKKEGVEADGEPVWARYNPPFTLWFLRRNEVLIPVKAEEKAPALPEGGSKK
jgi:effector-binding domain-containing protein